MDYKNGKIYCIRSPNTNKIYIGSTTTELRKRFYMHKWKYNKYKETGKKNTCSWIIFESGDAYIELIENYPCTDKGELHRREGQLQRQHKDICCNRKVEGRSNKEYKTDNKDKIKVKAAQYYQHNKKKIKVKEAEYRRKNKDKIKAYQLKNKDKFRVRNAEYRKQNKDKLKVKKDQYYQQNKKKINEKSAKYWKENKDKIKVKKAQYYQQNKDNIKMRQANIYQKNKEVMAAKKPCPHCGKIMRKSSITRHIKKYCKKVPK